jgi:hypothetical protein
MAGPLLTVDEANQWIWPCSTRLYQYLAIKGTPFSLDIHGKIYSVLGCEASDKANHLFLRENDHGGLYRLESSMCGQAYSINEEEMCIQDLIPSHSLFGRLPSIARCGNANFAHFIWNELDPLLSLWEHEQVVVPLYQDIVSIFDARILPGFRPACTSSLSNSPSVRLGSQIVSNKVQSTVLSSLLQDYKKDSDQSCKNKFSIILGIRGPGNRSIHNEETFYSELVQKISSFDGIHIFFDGVTRQLDNGEYPGTLNRIANVESVINSIVNRCKISNYTNLNGLSFKDWLPHSLSADFYITHEGTMQHKIGWLSAHCNGLILTGRKTARSIADWHMNNCEKKSFVHVLDHRKFVMDSSLPDDSNEERDRCMSVNDIDGAIAETLDILISEGLIKQD